MHERTLYIGLTNSDEAAAVFRAVEERGLTSFMNDTKWRALCIAIAEELPFPPAYQSKLVLKSTPSPEMLDAVPKYLGDWATTPEASMGVFIEWLKVAPRVSLHVGLLVARSVEDCSEQLRSVLKARLIPFRENSGFFTIYGHAFFSDLSPSEREPE